MEDDKFPVFNCEADIVIDTDPFRDCFVMVWQFRSYLSCAYFALLLLLVMSVFACMYIDERYFFF